MSIYLDVLDHYETIYGGTKTAAAIFYSAGHGRTVARVRFDGDDRHDPRDARDQEQIYEKRRKVIAKLINKILDRRGGNHAVYLRHNGRTHDALQNCLHVIVPRIRYHVPGIVFQRKSQLQTSII